MSEPHRNPVHRYKRQWYFWDEAWANRKGPYRTPEEAQFALTAYCIQRNKENPENPPYPRLAEWAAKEKIDDK